MSSLVLCPHPSACGVQSGHRRDRAALEACRRVGLALQIGQDTTQPQLASAATELLDPGTTRYRNVYATVEATGGTASEDTYQVSLESAVSDISWEEEFRQPIGEMTPTAQSLVHHYVLRGDPRMSDLLGEDVQEARQQVCVAAVASADPTSLENDFSQPRSIRSLMDHHKLQDWSIDTQINSDQIAGQCRFASKTLRFNLGMFTELSNEDRRDTVLHEIAHAKAGERAGHGRLWKAMASAIGARPETVAVTVVSQEEYDAQRSSLPWKAECAQGHVEYRRIQPKKTMLCGRCLKPSAERLMTWSKKGEAVQMGDAYTQSEWAFRAYYGLIEVSEEDKQRAKKMVLRG